MYFSVCTRPTTRRCSIHYAKNCIFGEACAVDVLNEDPWFSLGSVISIQFVVQQFLYPKNMYFFRTCVTLPTENKRFCIRNTMCMEDEVCTRNYGPFVMDPWHNPGYVPNLKLFCIFQRQFRVHFLYEITGCVPPNPNKLLMYSEVQQVLLAFDTNPRL